MKPHYSKTNEEGRKTYGILARRTKLEAVADKRVIALLSVEGEAKESLTKEQIEKWAEAKEEKAEMQ